MRTRGEIKTILTKEVDRARARLRSAAAAFDAATDSIPSGLPDPDGSLRVQHAGIEKSFALNALREAFQRYNRFILDDKVPADLPIPEEYSKESSAKIRD